MKTKSSQKPHSPKQPPSEHSDIELIVYHAIDKKNSENEANFRWLADNALKNVDEKAKIYFRRNIIIGTIFTTIIAGSAILGFPQLKNSIMEQIGERYVNKQIGLQLEMTRQELSEAQKKLKFFLLRNKALIGDFSAYTELESIAKTSPDAALFIEEINNYYTEQIPLYACHLCMNEIHFGYVKSDSTTEELFSIINNKSIPFNDRMNALKNITMRYSDGKDINAHQFCDKLIQIATKPTNLTERRVAIQCICYLSSIITPNKYLQPTMNINTILKWWNDYNSTK